MPDVLEPITKRTLPPGKSASGGEVLTLRGVSFTTFARLAAELGDSSRPRLCYDNPLLELRMPSEEHEELNRVAALMVTLIFGEWDVEARDLGSMTHESEATDKGFEPDTCFYADEEKGGTISIPLLAIEAEFTNSAINKLPVYAAFGMPELWRLSVDGDGAIRARFHILRDGIYTEQGVSLVLAPLTPDILVGFLSSRLKTRRLGAWIKSVQEWARDSRAV